MPSTHAPASAQAVRAWRESITIPTYGIGKPDPHPMFLEKRVYQGSSGKVYPYPVIDHIDNEKHDARWDAVFLENEYLKIMILPQLGGRIQMALDKTNDYHFVYYNRVIKPALVGLAGPWISGGIEFNWPQHHRPNTYGPVDSWIQHHADGSVTLWCSEIDRMYGTKGMHGLTLHPGRAYLEIRVRLYNRTDQPQTFLWWANPAVHVDDNHQSIFPPDVHAVMDHGKRDVSSFPIARGTYYKVNYAPGTDISRYRNIPVPTSYMAYHSDYNFVGSYDHGKQAGLLHVCNHHVSPGKKQWTWGNGDFGKAWDRHLTDADGPYIELMCGVYTDNQPDFSWLMPGEEKQFTQFFMPYKGVGEVRNATIDAAVGMEVAEGQAIIRAYTPGEQPGATVRLTLGEKVVHEEKFDGSPRTSYQAKVKIGSGAQPHELRVAVIDHQGRELVAWRPAKSRTDDIPSPAQAIDEPAKLDSVESLYLAGQHLEQYRHATREPMDYYAEGLRRDSGDMRCNNAMGLLLLRRGCFEQAAEHFQRAIKRLTRHNPNPYDGEPLYNLGLTLELLGRYDQAFDALYKSTWNAAQQPAAFFALARLARRRGNHAEALQLVRRCLQLNGRHHRARHLEVALLHELGRAHEAHTAGDAALRDDPFNLGVLLEQARATGDYQLYDQRTAADVQPDALELAADYAAAGLHQRAIAVLKRAIDRLADTDTAMLHYHMAFSQRCDGEDSAADATLKRAAKLSADALFPNRLDQIAVFNHAIERNPADAHAPYALGNLWYDKKQFDRAIDCWELATRRDATFGRPWRNLGLAYFNKRHDGEAAMAAYEKAFACEPNDPRVLHELDQLAKRLGHDPAERLKRLEAHRSLVDQRDDLYLEYVTLLNLAGRHSAALDTLLAHPFHPWEGGEGKVPAQYVLAITELARQAIDEKRYVEAITLLKRTGIWPLSLGEGKITGIQENNIHYLLGVAHAGQGDAAEAKRCFVRAGEGLSDPTSAMFYNDQPPDMIFYQGLAQRALQHETEATRRFEKLVAYGEQHVDDDVKIDYFAVSLPDFLIFDEDLNQRNRNHCHYMMGLGLLGLGRADEARKHFDAVLASDPAHPGARAHCRLLA